MKIRYIQNEFVFKDFEIKNLGENHDLYVQRTFKICVLKYVKLILQICS